MTRWRKGLEALALQPNVHIKLSEFGLKDSLWNYDDNRIVVLTALEIFGPERCMFASNFPVDGMCASFETIFKGFAEIVRDFTPLEQQALFHDNAKRIYRIAP